ncbi:MAG: biotin/lipoyl-containing protein [candidate division Zixibacteria bacterium]
MEYEFLLNGTAYSIKLEKAKSGHKAVLGKIEIPFASSQISDNEYSIMFDGESKSVYIAETNGALFVHINGRVIRLDKAGLENNNFAAGGDVFGAKDEVSTLMPGKIVKILVGEGDKVTLNQTLVIVESMKMENKIVSPTDGEIKSIHFSDGDLVEPGQPIIILIPAD